MQEGREPKKEGVYVEDPKHTVRQGWCESPSPKGLDELTIAGWTLTTLQAPDERANGLGE